MLGKFWIYLLVLNLVLLNLGLVYLFLFRHPVVVENKYTTISSQPSPIPTAPITPMVTIVEKVITNSSKISTDYIPIPGSGSLQSLVWADLPGTEFYFNTNDYPGLKSAFFEANFKLLNGNGLAYIRLFDATAGIEVWGSEINTPNQNFSTIISSPLSLRSGNRLYRLQSKSLTSDTTVLSSARLKIITEN